MARSRAASLPPSYTTRWDVTRAFAVDKLKTIDAQFVKASQDWKNPQNQIAALLLIRCHSAFRGAASLAMAGQAVETYVLSRATLEYAAYAVHIDHNPDMEFVWLDRHQGPEAMSKQRSEFSHRRVSASVTAANRHAGRRFEDLYQRTIDFGGHPNERSVTGSTKMIKDQPGKIEMLVVMLHDDGIHLDHALKTVAQSGLTALEMLQSVFNARFELLGINAAMLELRDGL